MRSYPKLFILFILLVSVNLFYGSCKSKKALAEKKDIITEVPPVTEVQKPIEPAKPLDADGDGVVDDKDDCPNEKGLANNNGCPSLTAEVFNYKNIQFEFNSSVLKTSSYAVLDAIAQQMKKNPQTKFQLNGHSSAEGSDQRNMMLSVDRANAVKAYLVNNGIQNSNLITKGFGESKPLVANTTEANKALNRRVEIKAN